MDPLGEPAHSGERIPTTLRLLALLETIVENGGPVTPGDLVDAMELPKATIHRLFQTLEAEGYLQREPDGRSYSVGLRMRRLAVGTFSTMRMRTSRLAVMRALAKDVRETCNLVMPDRESMVYLDRVETDWPLRVQLPVGTRVPFHCTASGKLYLSTLSELHLDRFLRNHPLERSTPNTITDPDALYAEILRTREAGHGQDNEEFVEGMIAFAMPRRDQWGRMPAVITFHAPTQRMPLEKGRSFLPRLGQAAEELSALL